ncbi:MAG TPA: glycosyltransferase [Bacteroidales bacterium]|nr:glycosyltransferase [Bacteroidales bacterium]
MKIACVILGTRGDVQPMLALATGLIKKGHDVTICAPSENEQLVKAYCCPFVAFGPQIRKSIKENPEKQKGGVAVTISPSQGKKIIREQINLLPDIIKGVDLLLAAGIVMGVQTAADILKVPYRFVAFYPVILGTTKDDPLKNRMMFGFGRKVVNLMTKGFINKQRANYGLPPIKDVWQHWLGSNVILACDKELSPAREGTAFAFTQTGFMLLPSKNELPAEVETFLVSGKPPVYIGFGSNPIVDTAKFSSVFEQVRDATGQRLIISKGWAEFPESNARDILYVDELPFDLLFHRLAAVIYHGGTGTMAAIARAGIPQAAFPFMGDQFENRNQIVKLGLGPATCDFKTMTAKEISSAITACVTNELFKKNAAAISKKLQTANGLELTVQFIEKEFDINSSQAAPDKMG